jgi:hypothetical protein
MVNTKQSSLCQTPVSYAQCTAFQGRDFFGKTVDETGWT